MANFSNATRGKEDLLYVSAVCNSENIVVNFKFISCGYEDKVLTGAWDRSFLRHWLIQELIPASWLHLAVVSPCVQEGRGPGSRVELMVNTHVTQIFFFEFEDFER